MRKTTLAFFLSLTCLVWVSGQEIKSQSNASSSTEMSATANDDSVKIENGTRLSAELQKTVDVRKAKVGDEVVLKTTQAIKSNGRTVVAKGARLLGRVTAVAQKSGDAPSRIGILFDRLEHGSLAVPITATISSVTNTGASARVRDEDVLARDTAVSSTSSTSTSTGVLGGVGGVLNSTTSAVGSTVNSTTNAVGSTTNSLGNSLGAIQITQSSSASAQGESVLSLQSGNLRLEKGTRFNLVLSQSVNAETRRDQ